MTRKLAIWLSWANFSDYHSHQLAAAIADRYDTTITYKPLDWDAFDVVMPFFPGPNRNPGCDPRKVVKFVWEPHEFGWARDAGTVCAASTSVYERIKGRYGDKARLLHWGVNPEHFYPQPMLLGKRIAGWCGQYKNPRKQYERLCAEMDAISNAVNFVPNTTEMSKGKQTGAYTMETMHQYYHRIHIYVCGSSSEGFCFPLLEATACGRPVVTFDVGVARDLQRTGAGVVIVDTWEELLEAVQWIDVERLSRQSILASFRNWTWAALRDDWLEVLDNAGA